MLWDTIIVGAGAGGLQAAIAAASEGLKVLVLEKGQVGGQIGQTPKLENSVFAAGGITGPVFAQAMRDQALAMGATILLGDAKVLDVEAGAHPAIYSRTSGADPGRRHTARSVILAMGNRWVELDIPGIKPLIGKKVHYGPVKSIDYDAGGGEVVVFGGGPSAGQAILALADSHNCRRVHAIMRSTLKMPQYLVDRIKAHKKVTVREYTRIDAVTKSQSGIDIAIREGSAGEGRWLLNLDALFMCNGLVPATDWLRKTPGLEFDSDGRVITSLPSLQTTLPNVYAIGDCRSGSTPRVGVAIGDGSMVVSELWKRFVKTRDCQDCKRILSA